MADVIMRTIVSVIPINLADVGEYTQFTWGFCCDNKIKREGNNHYSSVVSSRKLSMSESDIIILKVIYKTGATIYTQVFIDAGTEEPDCDSLDYPHMLFVMILLISRKKNPRPLLLLLWLSQKWWLHIVITKSPEVISVIVLNHM